jgi:hypothetical protein
MTMPEMRSRSIVSTPLDISEIQTSKIMYNGPREQRGADIEHLNIFHHLIVLCVQDADGVKLARDAGDSWLHSSRALTFNYSTQPHLWHPLVVFRVRAVFNRT